MDKDIELLNALAAHYTQCEQCRTAFATLQDLDYCETGMPLFLAWYNEPAGDLA